MNNVIIVRFVIINVGVFILCEKKIVIIIIVLILLIMVNVSKNIFSGNGICLLSNVIIFNVKVIFVVIGIV